MSDNSSFGDLDLNNIMQEAQKMQKKMQEAQKNLAELVVEGVSGAGLVKVEMNGRHYVIRVKLDPKLESESSETREDLIAAAINDAVRKLEDASKRAISELTAGIQLPSDFTDTQE